MKNTTPRPFEIYGASVGQVLFQNLLRTYLPPILRRINSEFKIMNDFILP